jgi:DNA-binding IclR family transcriptional regulator
MLTVDKTMKLLSYFSPAMPEIGLSELARMASLDKAATRRFLVSLAKHGFIEQNPHSKLYRLGSAFLRFARIREASFPLASIIQPILEELAANLGETAHASIAADSMLVSIGIAEPHRATRVHVDPSEMLPLHATASGIAYLSFAPKGAFENYIGRGKLVALTPNTIVSPKKLQKQIAAARENGFALGLRTFENEVIGLAAPLFDWSGHSFGAVSVASVASRFTASSRKEISSFVIDAAIRITRATGAEPHPNLLKARTATAP